MINIVGIGVGDSKNITLNAVDTLKNSSIIIGGKRQIESIKKINTKAKYIEYVKLTELIDFLKSNINFDISVVASGEPNLYGIGKYIIENMKPYEDIHIISGISSIAYLFSKLKLDMNDIYITSFHGRKLNEDMLLISKKTAFFTDSKTSLYEIAHIYLKNGKNPQFIIGENLSYKQERIIYKYANTVKSDENYDMYVLIALQD